MSNLTHEQRKVLNFFLHENKNILVSANPGTGKTFMVRELVQSNPNKSFLVLAFMVNAKNDLQDKLQGLANCTVSTINSVGSGLNYKSSFPYKFNKFVKDNPSSKIPFLVKCQLDLFKKEARLSKKDFAEQMSRVDKINYLVDLARYFFCENMQHLIQIAEMYSISDLELIQTAWGVLEVSNKKFTSAKEADFVDQLYQPVKHNMKPETYYDYIIVDECQDLSLIMLKLISLFANSKTKFVFLGQKEQAIMGFAGANPNSVEDIKNTFNCVEFPLTITFRNFKQITELVNDQFGTQMQTDKEGILSNISYQEMLSELKEGDLILARSYKARNGKESELKLITVWLDLLRNGINSNCIALNPLAEIKKKFILICMSDSYSSWSDINYSVTEYYTDLMSKEPVYQKQVELQQEMNSFLAFLQFANANSEPEFFSVLEKLSTQSSKQTVTLMSIHSSKGLEANRVFILNAAKLPYSYPMQKEWEKQQERNLAFVAFTRAKQELYLVN